MWLWRVSGTPWERHGQSTRWFNARTPAIAVFHVSPLAAVCARLVHQRRHTPELLDPEERLYSIRVSLRQVQAAHVSRGWYDNLKETRTVAAAWRMQALCPVLKVPARDGQQAAGRVALVADLREHRPRDRGRQYPATSDRCDRDRQM